MLPRSLPRSSRLRPSPSPSPTAAPQIAHVVTSDRSRRIAARARPHDLRGDAAQIARNGDRTVADAIDNVPGVNSSATVPSAPRRRVGIRGSSSRRCWCSSTACRWPVRQIDDVNLERSPSAASSASKSSKAAVRRCTVPASIGGVINIITAIGRRANRRDAALRDLRRTRPTSCKRRILTLPAHQRARTTTPSSARRTGKTRRPADCESTRCATAHSRSARVDVDVQRRYRPTPSAASRRAQPSFADERAGQRQPRRRLNAANARARAHRRRFDWATTSQHLAYTCNTTVDSDCPNSFFPTPAPSMSSNPPTRRCSTTSMDGEPAQRRRRRPAAARLRNRPDARRRAHRPRHRRRLARWPPTTRRSSTAYAQTAAYAAIAMVRRQRAAALCGSASRARRRRWRRSTRRRSAASHRSRTRCAQGQRRDRISRAQPPKSSTIPGSPIRISQPERTRVGDATLVAPRARGRRQLRLVQRRAARTSIVSPPPTLHSGERRPARRSRASTLELDAAVSRLSRDTRRHQSLSRRKISTPARASRARAGLCGESRPAVRRAAEKPLRRLQDRRANAGSARESPIRTLSPASAVVSAGDVHRISTPTPASASTPQLDLWRARLQSRQRTLRHVRRLSDAGTRVRRRAAQPLKAVTATGARRCSLPAPARRACSSAGRRSRSRRSTTQLRASAQPGASTRSCGSYACRASASPRPSARRWRSAARCCRACCAIRWSIRISPA